MSGKMETKAPRKRNRELPRLIGRSRRYVVTAMLRLFWAFA